MSSPSILLLLLVLVPGSLSISKLVYDASEGIANEGTLFGLGKSFLGSLRNLLATLLTVGMSGIRECRSTAIGNFLEALFNLNDRF